MSDLDIFEVELMLNFRNIYLINYIYITKFVPWIFQQMYHFDNRKPRVAIIPIFPLLWRNRNVFIMLSLSFTNIVANFVDLSHFVCGQCIYKHSNINNNVQIARPIPQCLTSFKVRQERLIQLLTTDKCHSISVSCLFDYSRLQQTAISQTIFSDAFS